MMGRLLCRAGALPGPAPFRAGIQRLHVATCQQRRPLTGPTAAAARRASASAASVAANAGSSTGSGSSGTACGKLGTKYEAVIGIETHVQLGTRTKAFCSCANEFGAEPNSNVCPVCLGHPVRRGSRCWPGAMRRDVCSRAPFPAPAAGPACCGSKLPRCGSPLPLVQRRNFSALPCGRLLAGHAATRQ